MSRALAIGNIQAEQTPSMKPLKRLGKGCRGEGLLWGFFSFWVTLELFTLNLVHIKKQNFASFVQTSYVLISVSKLKALYILKNKGK